MRQAERGLIEASIWTHKQREKSAYRHRGGRRRTLLCAVRARRVRRNWRSASLISAGTVLPSSQKKLCAPPNAGIFSRISCSKSAFSVSQSRAVQLSSGRKKNKVLAVFINRHHNNQSAGRKTSAMVMTLTVPRLNSSSTIKPPKKIDLLAKMRLNTFATCVIHA